MGNEGEWVTTNGMKVFLDVKLEPEEEEKAEDIADEVGEECFHAVVEALKNMVGEVMERDWPGVEWKVRMTDAG